MRTKTDDISMILSEYLLKGYVMTAKHCPECNSPLLRNRKEKETFCPGCENRKNYDEDLKVPSLANKKEDFGTISSTQSKENNEKPSINSNSISALLGKKLLEGWTMLDTLCPTSACKSIPLVRNKKGYSFCVLCEQTFILEADYNPEIHQAIEKKPDPITPQKPVDKIEEVKENIPVTESKIAKRCLEDDDSHSEVQSNYLGKTNYTNIFDDSHSALLQQIKKLSYDLSKSTDPAQIKLLASAVKSCFKALEALIKVSKDARNLN